MASTPPENPPKGFRALSIDGGGIGWYESLEILKAIMNAVSPGEKPCEYFHFIGGAGMGGILALLLGRLRLSIPECMIAYWVLSSTVIQKETLDAGSPLFDAVKLRTVLDHNVKSYTGKESPQVRLLDSEANTKTCIFAVRVAHDPVLGDQKILHYFRTYKKADQDQEDEDTEEMDPAISITDAAIAAIAAQGLLQEAILPSANDEPVKFMHTLYPLGLTDPADLVAGEIKSLYDIEQISQLISIGPGRVACDDIGDLLRLGSVTVDDKSWSPDKVTEHLQNRYREIIQGVPLKAYRRFDIEPVLEVRPYDFLSGKQLGEAGDAADKYLDLVDLPKSKLYLRDGEFEAMCWAICTGNGMVITRLCQSSQGNSYHPTGDDVAANNERRSALLKLTQELNETHAEHTPEHDPDIAPKVLLHLAASKGYIWLANFVLDHGGGAQIDTSHINGKTALHVASSLRRNEIVELFLKEGKAGTEISGRSGQTALHEAARAFGIETTKILLDHGANIDAGDKYNKQTALHLVIEGYLPKGEELVREELVRLLLDRKADIEARDSDGRTVLLSASSTSSSEELVKLLLDNHARIEAKDTEGRTALHLAIDGRTDELRFDERTIKRRRFDEQRISPERRQRLPYGRTYPGGTRKDGKLVELLLNKPIDIDAKDNNGWTALHVAVAGGYSEIIKIMITRANTEEKTTDGQTIYDLASKLPDGPSKDEIMVLLGMRTAGDEAGTSGST